MKACRNCRYIVKSAAKCPLCSSEELTEKYFGFVVIIDPERSELAKSLDIKTPGEYALLVE